MKENIFFLFQLFYFWVVKQHDLNEFRKSQMFEMNNSVLLDDDIKAMGKRQ